MVTHTSSYQRIYPSLSPRGSPRKSPPKSSPKSSKSPPRKSPPKSSRAHPKFLKPSNDKSPGAINYTRNERSVREIINSLKNNTLQDRRGEQQIENAELQVEKRTLLIQKLLAEDDLKSLKKQNPINKNKITQKRAEIANLNEQLEVEELKIRLAQLGGQFKTKTPKKYKGHRGGIYIIRKGKKIYQ